MAAPTAASPTAGAGSADTAVSAVNPCHGTGLGRHGGASEDDRADESSAPRRQRTKRAPTREPRPSSGTPKSLGRAEDCSERSSAPERGNPFRRRIRAEDGVGGPTPGNARTAGGSHLGARPSTEGALRARRAEDPAGRARRESPEAEDPGGGWPGTAPRPEMPGTDRGSHLGTRPSQRRAQGAPPAEDSAERASPLRWVLGGGGSAGRGGIPHGEPARPTEGPSGVGGGGADPTIIRR